MILVTGSAGHLGEALMRDLRARGRPACGIDIKPSAFTDACGSIADAGFVRGAMAGATAVIHAATLHKPHVATHAMRDFVDVNVTGTLNLLQAAADAGVGSFVFTSTTSAVGAALTPPEGEPAAWITEDVAPVPRNIYGTTKVMAETLAELFARRHGLPVVVRRAPRLFPEDDDDPAARAAIATANAQANELLHRRVDIADAVDAHLLAIERAPDIGFGRFILSATTPFSPAELGALRHEAAAVVDRLYPEAAALYEAQGWRLPAGIDRVYVNARVRAALGWRPRHDFAHVLDCLRRGRDFRSDLSRAVGTKGYHDRVFADGPYPVQR